MTPFVYTPGIGDDPPTATLYYGRDVREVLRDLPAESVHTVCTSPPYFGLRDYDAEGQIGLEATPDDYVQSLVEVFREVRRVLRKDGTVWLNLGDSYTSGGRTWRAGDPKDGKGGRANDYRPETPNGLKPKDLIGIPWRAALALQADGWYLRQDIIWHKPNPMPESVRDRCTKAHEYIFLLTKSPQYFYDMESVKEASAEGPQKPCGSKNTGIIRGESETRNRRSVWSIATRPYKGSHFATWPPVLVQPMVRAGTSERGCCVECSSPWKRLVRTQAPKGTKASLGGDPSRRDGGYRARDTTGRGGNVLATLRIHTSEWEPTCTCETQSTTRCTVLDPFSGSATTGMVALKEGRNYIGIDLNADYLELAKARLADMPAPKAAPEDADGVSVFDLFETPEEHP